MPAGSGIRISQLTDIGSGLAPGDQFILRDVSDAVTPNKAVTISGLSAYFNLGTAGGGSFVPSEAEAESDARIQRDGYQRSGFITRGNAVVFASGIRTTSTVVDTFQVGDSTVSFNPDASYPYINAFGYPLRVEYVNTTTALTNRVQLPPASSGTETYNTTTNVYTVFSGYQQAFDTDTQSITFNQAQTLADNTVITQSGNYDVLILSATASVPAGSVVTQSGITASGVVRRSTYGSYALEVYRLSASGFAAAGSGYQLISTVTGSGLGSTVFPSGVSTSGFLASGLTFGSITSNVSVTMDGLTSQPFVAISGFEVSGSGVTAGTYLTTVGSRTSNVILNRQDLVALEVWHEKVNARDYVYPYGNIQNSSITYTAPDGTSLSMAPPSSGTATTNGSGYGTEFSTYWGSVTHRGAAVPSSQTYSLFGSWQAAGGLVGRGTRWSTLTTTAQKSFAADPNNNMYFSDDGDFVQVRYRFRTLAGYGSDWTGYDPAQHADIRYENAWSMYLQGQTSSASGDFESTDRWSQITSPYTDDGLWLGTRFAYNNKAYALPIALVARRNQGAYHPLLNPSGAATFINTNGSTETTYATTDQSVLAPVDAFKFVKAGEGAIGQTSGRDDGYFYDGIVWVDINDQRKQAFNDLTYNIAGTEPDNVPLVGMLGQLAFMDDYAPAGMRPAGGGLDYFQVIASGTTGSGVLAMNNVQVSGTASGLFTTVVNKPGTQSAASTWVSVVIDGTQFYMPAWR
jgi:hypothetical protein